MSVSESEREVMNWRKIKQTHTATATQRDSKLKILCVIEMKRDSYRETPYYNSPVYSIWQSENQNETTQIFLKNKSMMIKK